MHIGLIATTWLAYIISQNAQSFVVIINFYFDNYGCSEFGLACVLASPPL